MTLSLIHIFFYQVIGKMDEKLDKVRQEAYAARVKYDVALHDLSSVDADLEQIKNRLAQLSDCERRYQAALSEKIKTIKVSAHPAAQQVAESESCIAALKVQKRELLEAINAGKTALHTVNEVLETLDNAEGWSTWDAVSYTHLARPSGAPFFSAMRMLIMPPVGVNLMALDKMFSRIWFLSLIHIFVHIQRKLLEQLVPVQDLSVLPAQGRMASAQDQQDDQHSKAKGDARHDLHLSLIHISHKPCLLLLVRRDHDHITFHAFLLSCTSPP